MGKIEVGKEYSSRSICDSNCIFTIKVLSRTDKSAIILDHNGYERRVKIRIDEFTGGEYLRPDRFSMAPTYRA